MADTIQNNLKIKMLNKNFKTLALAGDTVGIAAILVINTLACLKCGIWKPINLEDIAAIFALSILILYTFNLYELKNYSYLRLFGLSAFSAILFGGISLWLMPSLTLHQSILLETGSAFFAWVFLSRFSIHKVQRLQINKSRWLVVGESDYLNQFIKDCKKGQNIAEFKWLTQSTSSESPSPADFYIIGDWTDLRKTLNQSWSGIIVAMGSKIPNQIASELMYARLRGFKIFDLADFYESNWKKVPVLQIQNDWFALVHGFSLLHYPLRRKIKTAFDIIISIVLLFWLSPLMLIVSCFIKLESEGPIIYRQVRTGLNGREFTIYKFRSMRNDAEKNGAQWASVKDSRITKIGSLLRATRIDELPQLVNIIKGDMSFVGPRPERPIFNKQLEDAIPFYDFRHLVKPGVTGLAQVMYPYGASIEDALEKLQYDLYYIKNYTFILDFKIILRTISIVLFGKGR